MMSELNPMQKIGQCARCGGNLTVDHKCPSWIVDTKRAEPIFRGDSSAGMWRDINKAKTVEELRDALYYVCCKLQELEHRLERGEYKTR